MLQKENVSFAFRADILKNDRLSLIIYHIIKTKGPIGVKEILFEKNKLNTDKITEGRIYQIVKKLEVLNCIKKEGYPHKYIINKTCYIEYIIYYEKELFEPFTTMSLNDEILIKDNISSYFMKIVTEIHDNIFSSMTYIFQKKYSEKASRKLGFYLFLFEDALNSMINTFEKVHLFNIPSSYKKYFEEKKVTEDLIQIWNSSLSKSFGDEKISESNKTENNNLISNNATISPTNNKEKWFLTNKTRKFEIEYTGKQLAIYLYLIDLSLYWERILNKLYSPDIDVIIDRILQEERCKKEAGEIMWIRSPDEIKKNCSKRIQDICAYAKKMRNDEIEECEVKLDINTPSKIQALYDKCRDWVIEKENK
jgi:hypothetical protein